MTPEITTKKGMKPTNKVLNVKRLRYQLTGLGLDEWVFSV